MLCAAVTAFAVVNCMRVNGTVVVNVSGNILETILLFWCKIENGFR